MMNYHKDGLPPDKSQQPKTVLRSGYTTGACAAAAAAAATRALLRAEPVARVEIDLPGEKKASFAISRCSLSGSAACCSTIKDAGDDPDITHGAEIEACVEYHHEEGISIVGGKGVGKVTRPGLLLEVGEWAINPAPHRMILKAVCEELDAVDSSKRNLKVTISVPAGEELAKETLNPRLGIVNGISILGTTGIVKPFSASAYRIALYYALRVAAQNGCRRAVLSTGSRSEEYILQRHPEWGGLGCVQVGDHIGYALKQSRRLGFDSLVICGMVGKLSKLAQGRLQTHVAQGGVDFDFLAGLVAGLGAGKEIVARARKANTARHIQVILRREGISGLEEQICSMAARQVSAYLDGALTVAVFLFDIKGDLLAKAGEEGVL